MNLKIWEVIKYEGDNRTLVWKHPAEDFNTLSTLVVEEPMEAIFFSNGQIADVFKPGRYTLETKNIPLLRKLIEIPTGGVSTFHCQVCFVNKVEAMEIKWGTGSKVQFIEPNYMFPMEIGARGALAFHISDSALFVKRIVGMNNTITAEGIVSNFRTIIQSRVRTILAKTIKEKNLNIFEIDEALTELGEAMQDKLQGEFADYGVQLTQFEVAEVVRPEDDVNYLKLKNQMARRFNDIFEAQTNAQLNDINARSAANVRDIESQSMAQKRLREGYTYQDERRFDVAERVAENASTGEFTGMGIGMGMMAGVGGALGGSVAGAISGAMNPAGGMAVPAGAAMGAMMGAGMANQAGNMAAPAGAAMGAMVGASVANQAGNMPAANMANQVNSMINPAGAVNPAGGMVPPTGYDNAEQAPAKMKKCVCGFDLSMTAKFCPECGAKQPKLCPNCGQVVSDTAKFCENCGTSL